MLKLRSCAFALPFALLALAVGPARAAIIVAVDIGRNGQAVEPGFTGFSTPGGGGDSYDPQAFAGGTWDLSAFGVNPLTRNYGDITTTPLGDLLEDSVLVNASPAVGYLDLVFDGLTPGSYRLTTYHHSFDLGGATAEALAALEGDAFSSLGNVTSTTGSSIASFTTFDVDFSTTAVQDGFTLRFDPTNAAASFHFDLSGFELDQLSVPEPTMLWLVGIGTVALALRASRRALR